MDTTPTNQPDPIKKLPWENWQSAPVNSFIYQVQNGRAGKNHGFNNGLGRLNRYLNGTQKGRIYLIGADSGVGKTTLADFMFIFSSYVEAKLNNRKLKIIYYSFEISKTDKEAKWVSHYIFMNYGISLTPDYILGRIKGMKISEEHMAYIIEAYEVVQDLMSYIIFSEDAVHPTKIFPKRIKKPERKVE